MNVFVYYHRFEKGQDSHGLLKLALNEYLKETGSKDRPENLTVEKGAYGKPYIKELPEIHFSISHSGAWWCCAFGREALGLDLQLCRPEDKRKLAERFFHPLEKKWLKERSAEEFYRLWTYKESYVKYTGAGLIKGLDYFSVVSEDLRLTGTENAVQQELAFWDSSYYLVLTGKRKVDIVLKELILGL